MGWGNNKISNILKRKIKIPKLTGSMEREKEKKNKNKPVLSMSWSLLQSRMLASEKKNAPPPMPSSTQKAYLTPLFKAVAKK